MTTPLKGGDDAFVAKLDPEARSIQYMRLGGTARRNKDSSFPEEFGADIAVDGVGTAYVVGRTPSADFPMPGGMPRAPGRGGGFIVRVNPTNAALLSGAYLGEVSDASAIALDRRGDVYVAGRLLDRTSREVNWRQFVSKLTDTLAPVWYSVGVPHANNVSDIAVDVSGRAYVTGVAERRVPTVNPVRGVRAGDNWQAFLLVVSEAGEPLVSSPITSDASVLAVNASGVAVDSAGTVYVAGTSRSAFGRTVGERQSGGYVSKIVAGVPDSVLAIGRRTGPPENSGFEVVIRNREAFAGMFRPRRSCRHVCKTPSRREPGWTSSRPSGLAFRLSERD